MGIFLLELIFLILMGSLILRWAFRAWKNAEIDHHMDTLEIESEQAEEVGEFKKKHPNTKKSRKELDNFLNNK